MDWWEERDLVLAPAGSESAKNGSPELGATDSQLNATTTEGKRVSEIIARIGCLPCQHTTNRGVHDRNATLWSSWSVESGGKKVYFAG